MGVGRGKPVVFGYVGSEQLRILLQMGLHLAHQAVVSGLRVLKNLERGVHMKLGGKVMVRIREELEDTFDQENYMRI